MKKSLFVLLPILLIGIVSCAPSPEKKIHRVVADAVKDRLYVKNSYEETSFQYEELYSFDGSIQPYFDFLDLKTDVECVKNNQNKCSAQTQNRIKRYREHIKITIEEILKIRKAQYDELTPAGYLVYVYYTAKTTDGNRQPSLDLLLVDKNCKDIVFDYSPNIMEYLTMLANKTSFYHRLFEYIDELEEFGENLDVDDFIEEMSSYC